MCRCIACDLPLDSLDLKRSDPDDKYCSTCISVSNREFNANDKQYQHSTVSGILLDGSTLYVDYGVLDDNEEEEITEKTKNNA